MTPLSVVCFKWTPVKGYRSTYAPETVNVLRRMVARNYQQPHRFICVTDDADGIDPDVEIVPLWNDYAELPSPHGERHPSCYRRLKSFAPDISATFGPRFVTLDLDCVITGDLSPLWDIPDDFRIWGDTNPRTYYNGSMMLMDAGARPHVWQDFDPSVSPRLALKAGCHGSDQGWISYKLGPGEKTWSTSDGVYSYRVHLYPDLKRLPADARIVFFHGRHDPWSSFVQMHSPWVKEHWQ